MKTLRNFSLVLALAVVSLFSTFASAQPTHTGAFTLAQETHWGGVVLPAGSYKYSVEYAGAASVVTLKTGDGRPLAMILSKGFTQTNYYGPDQLTLENRAGATFVTSLRIASLGMSLAYSTPEPSTMVAADVTHPVAGGK